MRPVIDRKKDIELEEGELICSDCNGWGVVHREEGVGEWPYDKPYYRNKWIKNCEKCKETGKVDWVENVVGKVKQNFVEPGVYIRETDLSEYVTKNLKEDEDGGF